MGNKFPASTPEHLWVNWDDYHRAIEDLAVVVHASGWKFDQILCLARGGLRPGDVLSRIFQIPLAILSTSSYRGNAGTEQGTLEIASAITMARGTLAGRILLVDDLVDSGVTLQQVQSYLSKAHPAVTQVRSAVIWYKQCSVLKPDYHVHYLSSNPWIHQPFEQYDSVQAEQLAEALNNKKPADESAGFS